MASPELTIGWREWVSLPSLGLSKIKAKIDTGARTSCLHAFSVEAFNKDGKEWVRFGIHPHQDDNETEIYCEAEVFDKRVVSDSGGHKEERYVIKTELALAQQSWDIEITLTNRDTMLFRMLLGRTALKNKTMVNPAKSFLFGDNTSKPES